MHKKFLIVVGVLALFLWCSLAFGKAVPKPKKEATPQVTENKIDYSKIEWRTPEQMRALVVKELPGPAVMSAGVFKAMPDHLFTTLSPLFDTAGWTTYDLGGNDRISRQIALSALGYAHVAWTEVRDTANIGAEGTLREVYYSSWFSTGVRGSHEIKVSGGDENTRSGFTAVAVTEAGNGLAAYHHVVKVGLQNPGVYASIEATPSVGDFPGELNVPDSAVSGSCDNGIWCTVASHSTSGPDSAILHIVSVEGTGACSPNDFAYSRGRETSPGIFLFSPAQKADSSNDISVIAVASRKSGRVSLLYSRQANFNNPSSDADIFYIESQNYGREWVNGFADPNELPINVTNYQAGDGVRASGVLGAVYDEDDSLHIVWIAPLFNSGATASECFVYHWSKATGIDQVADGTYILADAGLPARSSSFNLIDCHIAVHDGTADITRKNYLYVTFNQYGPGTTDKSVAGLYNAEIYINASTNGGNTWGAPLNITNSATPGCTLTCDNDINPTCAERANDTIHISYLNDKSAGNFLGGQGRAVLSPVFYYKYPAYQPDTVKAISTTPPVFEDPVASPTLASIIDTSFKINNVGNQTLRIDSVREAGPSPWLQILTVSFPDTIPEGGSSKEVLVRFNGTGLATGTYVDTILVYNNATEAARKRLKLPVHLVVTDCGYWRRTHIVATVGDLKVKLGNTSNITDQDLSQGFFLGAPVNENLLFDGSAVVATTVPGDTLTLLDINQNTAVHPLSGIDTQTVTYTDSLTFAQAKSQQRPAKAGTYLRIGPIYMAMFYPDVSASCLWPGPWFKYWICQTWYIKVSAKPRAILWFTKMYKCPPPCWWPLCGNNLLTGNIYAGSALDVDLPSDTGGVINTHGKDEALKMVWQQGDGANGGKILWAQAAMVDTSIHIGNPDGFWSAKVHRNADFFPDDGKLIYRVISDSGFADTLTKTDTLPTLPADRHIQFASVCFDTTSDTVTYVQAMVVTENGYDSLKKNVEYARLDMKLPLPVPGCLWFAGDANKSNTLTLPDIILLVGHVFKGQPAPDPKCLGDCNNTNTITLPDIIILVGHVFKGQPKPPKDLDGPCCK